MLKIKKSLQVLITDRFYIQRKILREICQGYL